MDRRGRKSNSSTASTDHSPAPSVGGGPRKVAIPRLPKSELPDSRRDSTSKAEKNRVSHACEPCRQRKTKCSGERPNCRHCEDFKIPCWYADGKRDRAKNEMLTLQHKVEHYEKLLMELSLHVNGAAQLAIQKAIGKTVCPSAVDNDKNSTKIINNNEGGEAFVSAEVGSTGSNDHITDDVFAPIPESNNPVGYMGKTSEMVWITNTAKQLSRETEPENRDDGRGPSGYDNMRTSSARIVHESNLLTDAMTLETPIYHMDNVDLSVVGDQIDPFALPEKFIADQLIKAYFDTVHPMFPIVLKQLFMVQYESFYKFPFTPESSKRWLAILNCIFAIGAVYAHLTKADWYMNERAHIDYFARARVLALDGGVVYEVADSQQVQVAGLMGFYLLATNQTNRAWNITGLAIRYAQVLGLHLRSDVSTLSESEREMRVRIWYAIHNLERLLVVMTGRPSAIQDKDCSVPLPKPLGDVYPEFESDIMSDPDAEGVPAPRGMLTPSHGHPPALTRRASTGTSPSRNSDSLAALYIVEQTKLAKITVEALNCLYCPETMKMSWLEVQGKIADLESKCTKWRASLPNILDFGKRQRDQYLIRQRMTLAFQYSNTRIIINRPCLCKLDSRIPNESPQSKAFNLNATVACIEAARDLINLIPDEPNPVGLYSTSPWWCLLHYLVSAAAVVIVEIAMRAEHCLEHVDGLFSHAKKVVNWLKEMGKDNVAAKRSANVLSKLLAAAAPKIGHIYPIAEDIDIQSKLTPMFGVEQTYPIIRDHQVTANISDGYRVYGPPSHNSVQAFDEVFPIKWDQPSLGVEPSISSMFPTPQQMQGIDAEVAAMSRRTTSDIDPVQQLERRQQDLNIGGNFPPDWEQLLNFPIPIFTSHPLTDLSDPQIYPNTSMHLPPSPGQVPHPGIPSVSASPLHHSPHHHIPVTTSAPESALGNNIVNQMNYHKQIREDLLMGQGAQEQGRKRTESLQ